MAPRNKLGLIIPTDPRLKGFDVSFFASPSTTSHAPSPLSPNSRPTTTTSLPPPPPQLPSPSFHRRPRSHLSSPPPPPPPPLRLSSTTSSIPESDDLHRLVHATPRSNKRRGLSRQMSMCVTSRDVAWERKRRQMLGHDRRRKSVADVDVDITDEDLRELKGSIELGFGFNEEAAGPKLCNTLPALDLYFAVNRQLSPKPSPGSSPRSARGSSLGNASSFSSSSSPPQSSSLSRSASMSNCGNIICSPGDDPQQVKTKLRHWAQAVACSVMQSTT